MTEDNTDDWQPLYEAQACLGRALAVVHRDSDVARHLRDAGDLIRAHECPQMLVDLAAWARKEMASAETRLAEAERNDRDETAISEHERVATLEDVLARLGEDA